MVSSRSNSRTVPSRSHGHGLELGAMLGAVRTIEQKMILAAQSLQYNDMTEDCRQRQRRVLRKMKQCRSA